MLSFGLPSADSARMFALAHYDLETLSMATSALDEAWEEYCALLRVKPVDSTQTRSAMARRIMAAIDEGRRDPAQLKWTALRA
jgi:hypothetical protein